MPDFLRGLNIIAECQASRLPLWSCPPFLFVVMGFINVIAMVSSWLLASRYVEEPQIAALVVIIVSLLVFILGVLLINGFRQVAEANRMKSEFIAIVSHQIRSPLSIFKWTVDAMSRPPAGPSQPSNSVSPARYLSILHDSTEKMIQLVNMLLEVSRIEARKLPVERKAVDLGALTAELIRAFLPYAAAAKITLRYDPQPPTLPSVVGDAERIKMVVQNLIDNAIRYSPSGGEVTIRLRVVDRQALEWQIHDRGRGIPKTEQHLIFQKFFRARNARAHATQGSGLGLYVAKAVITELGGEMDFESEEGKGSTFLFRLPIYK